jgi:hypothetical protein
MHATQQDFQRDTDPYIRLVNRCQSCHQLMGGLRVFKGSTLQTRLLRGSLCQTVCIFFVLEATFLIQVYMKCTSPDCHHTEYHTPAYEYVDAEVLLVRIRAREDNQYIPQSALAPATLSGLLTIVGNRLVLNTLW